MNALMIASYVLPPKRPGRSEKEQNDFYELHGRNTGRTVLPVVSAIGAALLSVMAFDLGPF